MWQRFVAEVLHAHKKNKTPDKSGVYVYGGEREIRTLVRGKPKHTFQECHI